ncbi:TPA: disulfide bond formation protein B [Bacillus thuringiensis]|uniref:Probable disulfide formation protein n=5 Tax=Bacillus cereus group TaxID=86661 RepID=A0A9W4AFI3_BACTO|nr:MULTISPECIES: disulfide oxidoreductase [Bacillus cereus group]AEA19555.1 disulfide formation protein C 2 [Bacillus thuringiensis serovar chinensis CT-43]AGG05259.1 putative disulfide formation protein C 2 [Bacillus thuringiensis serovar thuringiensis str. IS5056]AHZ54938.1 disulfide formation protein C 2 [Bacillus thuringiensis serovar kurstaki str. YBT-1520]AIE37386.1 disulfide formation protein C 2 [Bacillus thuringiensis serovar kurstaki str. HD-1]AIM34672.1 disulfide formation protein C
MELIRKYHIFCAWTIAISAMLISLFFSEWMKLPPCDLCWYQRMAMYPLVLILGIGMYRKDPNVSTYAFPFACIGLMLSVYQITIQTFPASEMKICSVGVSCTEDYLNLFGFISIPMLSFVGILAIIVLLYIKPDKETKEQITQRL